MVDDVVPIGNQATDVDEVASVVDCGQLVLRGKCDNPIAMDHYQRAESCQSASARSLLASAANYDLISRNRPSPYRSNVSRIILRKASMLKPPRRQSSGLSVMCCRQS